MSKYTTVKFNAGNDNSGNPRRVFVVFSDGAIVASYDDSYSGIKAVTNFYHRQAFDGLELDTTVKEYERLVKWGNIVPLKRQVKELEEVSLVVKIQFDGQEYMVPHPTGLEEACYYTAVLEQSCRLLYLLKSLDVNLNVKPHFPQNLSL